MLRTFPHENPFNSRMSPLSAIPSDLFSGYATTKLQEYEHHLSFGQKGNEKDLQTSLRLHRYICTNGLETHLSVGKYLVSLFVELDNIWYAHQAFQKLLHVDESSWNALICGYVKHGDHLQALRLYQKMKKNHCSHHPCGYTFVALLKACTTLQEIEKGSQIHADIARFGLFQVDIFISTTLIDMYAKFGFLGKAQDVFDSLDKQNTVLWNALISGFVEHGQSEEALELFEQMQESEVSPDAVTLVCTLKACSSNIKDIVKGQIIHADITRKGFLAEGNIFISSVLLEMYAKCGSFLDEAQYVFNKIHIQNAVSWTSLIAGYTEHGHGNEALCCYRQMQNEGFSPHISTLISILKACTYIGSSNDGRDIHAEITKRGISGEILIDNSLIDMYSKCGLLNEAKFVFYKLPSPTVVSWTVLMSGYSEHGSNQEVMEYLEKMQQEAITLDSTAFIFCLKACADLRMLAEGYTLHTQIVFQGLLETDSGASLVRMYARCGSLMEACSLFDSLQEQTIILWNVMIAAYVESGLATEALACFAVMQYQGFLPDGITFLYILNVYGSVKDKNKGFELHAEVSKRGLDQHVIDNALVSMYAGCDLLPEAENMLQKLPRHTSVPWATLIAAQVERGYCEEALHLYDQIRNETNLSNSAICVCSLKACTAIAAIDKGREIHNEIIKRGMLTNDRSTQSTLVAFYIKLGLLVDAYKLLDGVTAQDHVSWTAVIKGYMDAGYYEQALDCFWHIKREGIPLDGVTFICAFSTCGSICTSVTGLEMHSDILKMGFDSELVIGNSLVDMYAKCGLPTEAKQAFDIIVFKDIVSWNSLITCYSQLGDCVNALGYFQVMIGEGVHLDLFTFFSILNVCSHSGLAEDGYTFFNLISKDYFLNPSFEHYTCMVDLLARTGQVNEAVWVIEHMPLHPCLAMWHVIMGACEKSGNDTVGRQAFNHTLQLNEMDSAAYVAMSNILVFG